MFLPDATVTRLLHTIRQLDRATEEVVLILIGEEEAPDLHELVAAVRQEGIPFFGAVFPAVVHGGRSHRRGAVIQVLPVSKAPVVIRDLDRGKLPDVLPHYQEARAGEAGTVFMCIHAAAARIGEFLDQLYNRLGDRYSYLGAGAGRVHAIGEPCLFSNDGVFENAALVALVDWPSCVASRHGWRRKGGPLVASRTEHNVIYDLNWRRARATYEDVICAGSGDSLNGEALVTVAHRFPLGIGRQGAEDLIRIPVAIADGEGLVCAGEVEEDTVLHLLEGDKALLVEAARQVAEAGFAESRQPQRGLIADCVCRALLLGDEHNDELQAVSDVYAQYGLEAPEGMLTLGEVASTGRGLLEWYTGTVVNSVFYAA